MINALAWVERQTAGGPTRKLVLTLMAEYADDCGHCLVDIERLAEQAEVKPRQVQNVHRYLREAGLIESAVMLNESGQAIGTIHRLMLDDPGPCDEGCSLDVMRDMRGVTKVRPVSNNRGPYAHGGANT